MGLFQETTMRSTKHLMECLKMEEGISIIFYLIHQWGMLSLSIFFSYLDGELTIFFIGTTSNIWTRLKCHCIEVFLASGSIDSSWAISSKGISMVIGLDGQVRIVVFDLRSISLILMVYIFCSFRYERMKLILQGFSIGISY